MKCGKCSKELTEFDNRYGGVILCDDCMKQILGENK